MNRIITEHFDAIETYILQSPAFKSYTIIRSEIAFGEGKLRIKSLLQNGGSVEFFIYVCEAGNQIQLLKYSFHWQDKNMRLMKRWDNAPHYPNLPNAPHHIHESDGSVSGSNRIPNILQVLKEIADHPMT